MNPVLAEWNQLDREAAIIALNHCCAATRWAEELTSLRPFANERDLLEAADKVWATMREEDWLQAFRAHPRIGERKAIHASAQSATWSTQEQAAAATAESETLEKLAAGNRAYEDKFGFTYIVCATGRTVHEMLEILTQRLISTRAAELAEAAEQQRQITEIRLRKWLGR